MAHVPQHPTDQVSSPASSVDEPHPTAIRLAAGVAHQLNNILTVVGGHASVLLETLPGSDPVRQSLEAISAAGDAGAQLTEQLLAFAGQQPLRLRICAVADLIAAARCSAETAAGPGVEVAFFVEPNLPGLMVDPARFEEILNCLTACGGASLETGGRIEIKATSGPPLGDAVAVSVTARVLGADVLSPPEAFEPFGSESQQVGKADHIRLAAVWGTMRQSGGSILAETGPQGIDFSMLFPTEG